MKSVLDFLGTMARTGPPAWGSPHVTCNSILGIRSLLECSKKSRSVDSCFETPEAIRFCDVYRCSHGAGAAQSVQRGGVRAGRLRSDSRVHVGG